MIKDTPKATRDPFPHLPRRSVFGDIPEVPTRSPGMELVEDARQLVFETETKRMGERIESDARAPLAIAKGEKPSKRGRPKSTEPKPWEAEGVSRRTWFRRQPSWKGRTTTPNSLPTTADGSLRTRLLHLAEKPLHDLRSRVHPRTGARRLRGSTRHRAMRTEADGRRCRQRGRL